jgi:hypothetical protein
LNVWDDIVAEHEGKPQQDSATAPDEVVLQLANSDGGIAAVQSDLDDDDDDDVGGDLSLRDPHRLTHAKLVEQNVLLISALTEQKNKSDGLLKLVQRMREEMKQLQLSEIAALRDPHHELHKQSPVLSGSDTGGGAGGKNGVANKNCIIM